MGEKEREIEVRTLSGESVSVFISQNDTVNDLKLYLSRQFPPASSSPNFHLFFKGSKLQLQSQINSLEIESGEFLVLVPFTKKDKPGTPKPESFTDMLKQGPVSGLSQSAYVDIMQDMQSFVQKSGNVSDNSNLNAHDLRFGLKRIWNDDCSGREEGSQFEFLWSVFCSPSKDIVDEEHCERFVEVLSSLSCLTKHYSRKCMLVAGRGTREDKGLCLCPSWLKKIMGTFAFLNIFAAFVQIKREVVTCSRLEEAIKRLSRFGLEASFQDIENLFIISPEVVSFANDDASFSSLKNDFAIIIQKEDERNEIKDNNRKIGQKHFPNWSKTFDILKMRQISFDTNLRKAVESLMRKTGSAPAMLFSLEDLLKFVKEGGSAVGTKDKSKSKKSSQSSAPKSYSFRSKCKETKQLLPVEMVQHLRDSIGSGGQIVHVEDIGARRATYVEIPQELSDNTKSVLKCMGISKLYSHQAESIQASLAGKNVVVATMTSSGKSLCYNVPVLEVLSQSLSYCALYMFPTKALAQDQLRALLAMKRGFDASINVGVYDGDTSQKDRLWLRDNARLLITNPDMLHMSILPCHGLFKRFLSNLRFVVIDEAHTYKGAFGCHAALILRRVRRLCSHVYGSDPSFVFCSATSANPREHCMQLGNLSTLELIDNDGSPSSQKHFVLWNPISLSKSTSIERENGPDASTSRDKNRSPIAEVSYLFAEMVQHGLRCIAFCRSRKLTELVLSYTREILQQTAPNLVDSICSYRAGYTAEDRRKIESDFFSGKLCGIAATNALELGIDVGHIDATLHLGFPGSIASLWQQAGRSGRREQPSIAVYIAFEGPLDQYFMRYPRKLFDGAIECCYIDAQNQQVLEQHLTCAAVEHPLSLIYDEKYFGSGLRKAVLSLKSKGELSSDPSRDSSAIIWSYIGHEKTPSRVVSIRAIETVRYKVIDVRRDEVIEEIEESKAFFQVYEGAVYMNQGKTYLVTELNVSEKIALCRESSLKYYTKTRDFTDIHVIGGDMAYPARIFKNQSSRTTAQACFCRVTTTWFGYYIIQRGSNKILDTCDLSLPKYSYESQAAWIRVSQSIKQSVEEKDFSFRGGLHAASHALLNVVPLFIRCNSSDLAPECPNPHDTRYVPERILIYDQHPGGTGVSMQIQPYFTELLNSALELLTSCNCIEGCPNCIHSIACHEYNEVIHKDAAILIIKGVLDEENASFKDDHDSTRNTTQESADINSC